VVRVADVQLVVGGALIVLWILAVPALSLLDRRVPWTGSRRARTSLLIGTAAVALLFTAQAAVVDAALDGYGLATLDGPILDWFVAHRTGAVTAVMTAASDLGGTAGMAALAAVTALLLLRKGRRMEAGLVAVVAIGAGVLVDTLKNLYERQRPPVTAQLTLQTNFALPSGHALGSTAVLGVVATVVVLLARRRVWRVGAVAAAALGAAVVGVSRLYLGVHWLTDVVAGWLLGATWLAVCVTVFMTLPLRSRTGAVLTAAPGDGGPTGPPRTGPPPIRRRRAASVFGAAALATGLAACAGQAAPPTPTADATTTATTPVTTTPPPAASPAGPATPDPNAPELNAAGDIPDNQVFVPYSSADGLFRVSVPEGWARTTDGAAVAFTDKFNSVRAEAVSRPSAPDVASATADEVPAIQRTAPGFRPGQVTTVGRKAGQAVLITYTADSSADPVTGKSVATAVERYEFWKGGQEVVLTLTGPQGADNVDPWRTVSDSFGWLQ
jgi:membrane-associated phospholipid phosphatase